MTSLFATSTRSPCAFNSDRLRGWVFRLLLSSLILLVFGPLTLASQVLQVRHDHDPWGACRGELTISDSGLQFTSSNKARHSRQWSWLDIQSFDRKGDRRFSILTWKDQKWKLGLDRYFNFTVLPGSEALSEASFQIISSHMTGTVTDRIPIRTETEYSVAVKHLHKLGGCEGTLRFGKHWVVFESDNPHHSRSWKRGRDIESVWSINRYQLELHVFEDNRRAFDKTRRFRFWLKEPLDPDFYQRLRYEFLPVP